MQVTPKLSRERLLAIVHHLRKPQSELHNSEFDFSNIITYSSMHCGTVGCAMGEFPVIFPRHFNYPKNRRTLTPRYWRLDIAVDDVMVDFLGIPVRTVDHLFYPLDSGALSDPALTEVGIDQLTIKATKEEVADNIERYVNHFLADV